jgi:hypothetical protein
MPKTLQPDLIESRDSFRAPAVINRVQLHDSHWHPGCSSAYQTIGCIGYRSDRAERLYASSRDRLS